MRLLYPYFNRICSVAIEFERCGKAIHPGTIDRGFTVLLLLLFTSCLSCY